MMFRKVYNFVLIFTLIGKLSLTSMAYCMDTYLRNPLIKKERLVALEKQVIKIALRETKKNYGQLLEELTDLLIKTLSPLEGIVVTIDSLKELFEPNEKKIYQLISQIKENRIRKTMLQDDFRAYFIYKRNDLPETGLCEDVSVCVCAALNKIGKSPEMIRGSEHAFIKLSSVDGDIAIDLTSRQINKKDNRRIAIVMLTDYEEELKGGLFESLFEVHWTIASNPGKTESLKERFKLDRKSLLETLVLEKAMMINL